MTKLLISFTLILTSTSAFAMRRTPRGPIVSTDGDKILAECMTTLSSQTRRLTDQQTRGLFGSPHPAGLILHRDFVRDDATVVTVTYRDRGVGFEIVGLSDEEATALAAIVRTDVEGQIRAKVYAGHSGDENSRGKTVRHFAVTSGMRHPTTEAEATQFFATLTAVFAARLKNIEIRDRFGAASLPNPDVQF